MLKINIKNKTPLLVIILLSSLLLSNLPVSSAQPDEDIFIIGEDGMGSHYFNTMYWSNTWGAGQGIYSFLTHYGYEPMPDLAYDWESSEDGLTYTFNLLEDISWHDGEPYTSEDVESTFYAIAENSLSLGMYYLEPLVIDDPDTSTGQTIRDGAIETPDDYTVIFHLEKPFAPFMAYISFQPIIAKHVFEGQDVMSDEYINEHVIGTGPYKLDTWSRDEYVKIVKYEDYNGLYPATVDTIMWKFYESGEAKYLALKAGEIDFCMIDESNLVDVDSTEGLTSGYLPLEEMNLCHFLHFNMNPKLNDDSENPLSHFDVRKAIYMAVDIETIVEELYYGYFPVANQFTQPGDKIEGLNVFNESLGYKQLHPYDPEVADALLDASGYEWEQGDPYRFTLIYVESEGVGGATAREFAEILKSYLNEVGIDLDIQLVDYGVYQEKGIVEPQPKSWHIITNYWSSWGIPREGLYIFHSSQNKDWGYNCGNFQSPEYDELIEKATQEPDPEKAKLMYMELSNILNEELPALWVRYYGNTYAWDSSWENVKLNLLGWGWVQTQWMFTNLEYVGEPEPEPVPEPTPEPEPVPEPDTSSDEFPVAIYLGIAAVLIAVGISIYKRKTV